MQEKDDILDRMGKIGLNFSIIENPEPGEDYFDEEAGLAVRIRVFTEIFMDVQNPHMETPHGFILPLYQAYMSGYRPKSSGDEVLDEEKKQIFLMNKELTKEMFVAIAPEFGPYVDLGFTVWYGMNLRVYRGNMAFVNHMVYNYLKQHNPLGRRMNGHIFCKMYKEPQYEGHQPFEHPRYGQIYRVNEYTPLKHRDDEKHFDITNGKSLSSQAEFEALQAMEPGFDITTTFL